MGHQSDDEALAVLEVGNGDRSDRVELWVFEIPRSPTSTALRNRFSA